jgi:hypothetical protein
MCTMCCVALAIADAKPRVRRVVVLEFDGSQQLASAGRSTVLSVLGDEATIVPPKEWNDAFARSSGHGPERWERASNKADVDAVIDGWVQPEGRRNRLTIAVRDAVTGAETGTVSIVIDAHGVPAKETEKLASHLHDMLGKIAVREHDAETADHADDPPKEQVATDDSRHEDESHPEDDTHEDNHHEDRHHDDDTHHEVKTTKRHTVVDRDALQTPRFAASGGLYVAGRAMEFTHGASGTGDLPSYPGQTATGIALHANAFPLPRDEHARVQSGPGVTFDLRKSLASSTATGGYSMSELTWEVGAHYRIPISPATIDLDFDGGRASYRLVDRPASVTIPSATYSYLGGGAHVDLAAADDVTLGVGVHYMYLTGVGEIGEPDWYGSGLASGVALDATGVYEIDKLLYLEGRLEYRRVSTNFDGSGAITQMQMTGPMNVVDSAKSGAVNLGVRF